MDTHQDKPTTIDDYIAAYPEDIQQRMQAIRVTMRAAAPDATEALSYGVPTLIYRGKNLISFGAAKHHIGIYPTPSAITAFQKEIAGYQSAKGSVQLPLSEPVPLDLIRDMTAFRVAELDAQAASKPSKKKSS